MVPPFLYEKLEEEKQENSKDDQVFPLVLFYEYPSFNLADFQILLPVAVLIDIVSVPHLALYKQFLSFRI